MAVLLWGFRSSPNALGGVLLIYEPLCSSVNKKKKKKKAGVITNSLLTGSIIYEQREEVLEACSFFGIPTRPELG